MADPQPTPAPVTHDARGKPRVQTVNTLPSLTVQSDVDQAEIHSVLKRYNEVGIIDHMAEVDAIFMDVTQFDDFHDVVVQSKLAETEFLKLPSKLREVFHHDVSRWLDAAHDPEKLEALRPQLEKLGAMKPKAPPPAPPATPPAPAPGPPAAHGDQLPLPQP